jgi:serine/threonine-protein kinase
MLKVGEVIGRFALQQELGRGPMSEVFLALERGTNWKVALKFFLIEPGSRAEDHHAWAQRMLREARAAAAFQHERIVRVHEVGELNGEPYLVRDFIEGRSLVEVIADRPPATLEWKLRWMRELAGAIADIHRAGLVHRDVKPSNVLVRRDGALRLLDFGVARRAIDRAAGFAAAPVDGRIPSGGRVRVLGTAAYMAPERFGNQGWGPATDQFGWGVLAYEILAGRIPWGDGDGTVKIIEAILTQHPPSIRLSAPEIPPAIDVLVVRALAKTPAARFPSMDDLVRAFDEAVP